MVKLRLNPQAPRTSVDFGWTPTEGVHPIRGFHIWIRKLAHGFSDLQANAGVFNRDVKTAVVPVPKLKPNIPFFKAMKQPVENPQCALRRFGTNHHSDRWAVG